MDTIQRTLIKAGRKDLAQEYYRKISSDIQGDVIDFFKSNPNPADADLHKWAEGKNYDVHEVETIIYTLATKYVNILSGGQADKKKVTERDVDPKELAMGMEVEKEHTSDESTAKEVALDHLVEIPNYYTKLKKMEGK